MHNFRAKFPVPASESHIFPPSLLFSFFNVYVSFPADIMMSTEEPNGPSPYRSANKPAKSHALFFFFF